MPLGPKQTAQRIMGRFPVYRVAPRGALRSYAALRYHGRNSSKEEITEFVRSMAGIPTRYFSAAIVAAEAAFATGQDDLLADTLDALERRFPEQVRQYLLRADLHRYYGRYAEALRSAEQARLLQPTATAAVARVVRLSYRARERDEADQRALTALRRFPRTAEVLWAVTQTCTSPEQWARIDATWRDRVSDPADLVRAVRQLATAAGRAGEVDAAVELYRRAIGLLASGAATAPRIAETRLEGRGATRAIEDLVQLLDGAGVRFFFAAGTALGLVRAGRPLGADGDIDVGVFDADWDRADLISRFTRNPRFDLLTDHPRSKKIGLRHRGGSPVDIFRFYQDGGRVWHDSVFVRWHNTPFEVRRQEVGGALVPLPADPDHYLTENYGDWRTPNPAFDAFTGDAPNVEVTWPEYQRLHLVRRAFKQLATGDRRAAAAELRRAGESPLATTIGETA